MPSWRERVRRHLPPLGLRPERETEVIEELAQLLEDYADGRPGAEAHTEAELKAWIRSQIPEWTALAAEIRRNELPRGRRRTPATANELLAASAARRRTFDMNAIGSEMRHALRMLAKNPAFSALAILTLALGIGLNTAVFSVVNAVLLRPLPVNEPGRLVNVYSSAPDGFLTHEPMAHPDLVDLQGIDSFSSLAAYSLTPMMVEWRGESRFTFGELAGGDYFPTLGLRPFLGRLLDPADDRRGAPQPVVVLSHRSWQRRFGGDPAVLGETLRLNGESFTIVGVAPPEYLGLIRGLTPELWVPLGMTPQVRAGASARADGIALLDDRGSRWHWVVGRLAPEVDLETARAQVDVVAARLSEAYPESNETRTFALLASDRVRILPGVDTVVSAASAVVMGLVALVLLIACGNLANMLLARALGRRKEIATRLSLGASRWQVVRLLLLESLALALAGGAGGVLLALASNRLLDRLQLPLPVDVSLGLALDWRVLGFTLGLSTLTAILFGLAPALSAARTNLADALHDGARGSSGSRRQRMLRHGLVVGQVALSLLLLICAGLSVRSLANADRIDPGFDPSGLVTASYELELHGYTAERSAQFFDDLQERLEAGGELESVSYTSHLPLTLAVRTDSFAPEGKDTGKPSEWPSVDTAMVSEGYFVTMGIPLRRGRAFTRQDGREAPTVAVVNEALAERFWPGEEPIGKRFRRDGDEGYVEVIGVARDGKYRTLGEEARPFIYQAERQRSMAARFLIGRAAAGTGAALQAIRRVSRELDEKVVIVSPGTAEQAIGVSLLLPRAGATLFGLFGLLGLILASVGIYGVISYAVSQRTREIGVRVALGARRIDILALVVRQGLWLVGIGLALGLGASLLMTRALAAILYGIAATDALTFAGVSAFLAVVALLASYVPARRAARVDPLVALRTE